jgi:putative NADPH-quinone reductase
MKKILIVTAHPSSHGFTHRIANTFKSGAESKGHEVEILDLYKTDLQIPFLKFEEKSDMANLSPAVLAIQDKMRWSTDMVFIHPLWWMGTPAIMKNFFDNVLTPGFAYKYIDGKRHGLLKDKMGHVIITCDGPMYLFKLIFTPFKTIWNLGLLYFCGLRQKTFQVYDRSLFKDENDRLKFLAKIQKIAERL